MDPHRVPAAEYKHNHNIRGGSIYVMILLRYGTILPGFGENAGGDLAPGSA